MNVTKILLGILFILIGITGLVSLQALFGCIIGVGFVELLIGVIEK
jgi:hypothetical protein